MLVFFMLFPASDYMYYNINVATLERLFKSSILYIFNATFLKNFGSIFEIILKYIIIFSGNSIRPSSNVADIFHVSRMT